MNTSSKLFDERPFVPCFRLVPPPARMNILANPSHADSPSPELRAGATPKISPPTGQARSGLDTPGPVWVATRPEPPHLGAPGSFLPKPRRTTFFTLSRRGPAPREGAPGSPGSGEERPKRGAGRLASVIAPRHSMPGRWHGTASIVSFVTAGRCQTEHDSDPVRAQARQLPFTRRRIDRKKNTPTEANVALGSEPWTWPGRCSQRASPWVGIVNLRKWALAEKAKRLSPDSLLRLCLHPRDEKKKPDEEMHVGDCSRKVAMRLMTVIIHHGSQTSRRPDDVERPEAEDTTTTCHQAGPQDPKADHCRFCCSVLQIQDAPPWDAPLYPVQRARSPDREGGEGPPAGGVRSQATTSRHYYTGRHESNSAHPGTNGAPRRERGGVQVTFSQKDPAKWSQKARRRAVGLF
ncbi:hypothetical protein F5X68DRAFT_47183 [Plectosphaerella plurivora]|uniref:Uncharacterized protein n=1 Tax=Plectosphaerella plurivora TaxID=936078 RepID=A0A9P8VJE3_9PEZI|nr:hypothetical protein F5X68DRAFT_47183 [Plectosphaerella plurivora]